LVKKTDTKVDVLCATLVQKGGKEGEDEKVGWAPAWVGLGNKLYNNGRRQMSERNRSFPLERGKSKQWGGQGEKGFCRQEVCTAIRCFGWKRGTLGRTDATNELVAGKKKTSFQKIKKERARPKIFYHEKYRKRIFHFY